MDKLFNQFKSLVNDSKGTCIVKNGEVLDANHFSFATNDKLSVVFADSYDDIEVSKSDIKDIRFDIFDGMTVAVLCLYTGYLLVHCLQF
jgi:translation elongation factor P/translation initiation factor 5A